MMKVDKVNWLSKPAKEAELTISDGIYKCVAFSHPCNIREGQFLKEPLHAFMLQDLMLSDNKSYFIHAIMSEGFSHACVAKVVDVEKSLVRVGDVYIVLEEELPAGIVEGDFIQFECLRLDVI